MSVSRRVALTQLALAGLITALLPRPSAAQTAETATYTYDAQGRLTRAAYANGVTIDYSYDAAGNRTQVVRAGGNAPPPPPASFNQTIQITGTSPVNLRTLANNAGYDGAQNANVIFQLASGVQITGAAGAPAGGIAIDTGTWPTSSYSIMLTLQVSGKVYGGGGNGGGGNGGAAGAGGDAVYCRLPMLITVNSGGEIKAGGGGGGGGGRGRINVGGEREIYGGGGGGGGAPNGPGGAGGSGANGNGAPGAAGTIAGGGAGGAGSGSAGYGGNGATYGASGAVGASSYQAGGAGGIAGYAVRKNGNTVHITNNGAIVGTQG